LTDNLGYTNKVFPSIWKEIPMNNTKLTFDEVNEALDYNELTGELIWKISPGQRYKAGSPAGTWKSRAISTGEVKSYLYVVYKGRTFTASQVIWLLKTGEWPSDTVLFVDGNTRNLRFDNLKLPMFPSKKTITAGVKSRKMSDSAQRHYGLKRYYGISIADYAEMYHHQNGKCAICGNPETVKLRGKVKPLSVDHNHTTGEVRKLLCAQCNHLLGHAKEDVKILQKAIEYLNSHSSGLPVDDLGNQAPQTGLADAAQTSGLNLVQKE